MIKSTGEVRKGKDSSREFERNFYGTIKEFHGGGVLGITSDEENGITMVEAWMDVSFPFLFPRRPYILNMIFT